MRSMRREPEFDNVPLRRPRRAMVMDEAARPAVVTERRPSKGKKKAKVVEEAPSLLVRARRMAARSPMVVGSLGFLVLAAGAGLVEGGHLSFSDSEATEIAAVEVKAEPPSTAWFPISDVTAAGNYHTRRSDLMEAIGVTPGFDMMDVDPEIVRAKVEALDWVDQAQVARLWPATLQVKITEKEPYAIWQTKEVLWLIDRGGRKITKEDVAEFAGLPMLVGDGAPQHAAELLDALKRFPVIQRVNKASVRVGDRRWDLHLKNGIQVRLPEDGVEEALHRLTILQQEQKIFDRDIESVDLRLPDRLVIKPRGGAAESVAKGEST